MYPFVKCTRGQSPGSATQTPELLSRCQATGKQCLTLSKCTLRNVPFA